MSWRTVVVSNSSKLDYQLGFLVVRGQETHKIHLNEISTLIVESTAVSVTAYLLSELVKHKIKVVFCDEKRNPSSELLPYYGSHDTSQKVRKQMEWTKNDKESVWTEIVSEKINKQADLLERFKKEEFKLLRSYVTEIEFGDVTNREGHAAKVYFNALFGKKFTRTDENSINAALNYGYSIILSAFNREIVANGYVTQIGIFHDNMFNQFNLGSDLMEPFRPIIDEFVYNMKPEIFETEEKHRIIEIMNQEVYIDGRAEYIPNAINIYCRSVFEALNDKDVSLIKFYKL
ncbi:MAG: type II CRISPR-associated endonuclease Cas1 [Lachnospiraceae bacterium]|nr:type II CRISPR-associated endonuclease Cas1 [Lachnospiraceae bacterium]